MGGYSLRVVLRPSVMARLPFVTRHGAATATATPTPTPPVLPQVLPPTGSLGALMEDSSSLILFALIGLTLIGGSAWNIWGNRRWQDRRGNGS